MSSSQGYTVEPPAYTGSAPKKGSPAYGATSDAAAQHEPLLAGQGAAPRDAWADEDGDGLEGDFKVRADPVWHVETEACDADLETRAPQIGVTVSQSSQDVRNAFVCKVYGVLFCQIVSPSARARSVRLGARSSCLRAQSPRLES